MRYSAVLRIPLDGSLQKPIPTCSDSKYQAGFRHYCTAEFERRYV